MSAAPRIDDRRSMLKSVRGRLRAWVLPWALVLLYAWPFPHFEFLRSPNELSRLYQVRAIVDDGTIAVNGPVQRYGPVGDLSEAKGRLFPNKAPGISFLGAPVYYVIRILRGGAEQVPNRALVYFLRLFCSALPTLLLLRPLRKYAARVSGDVRAADAAVLTYAFGSLAFSYSLLFFSHQLSANLAAGAFLALEKAKESRKAPALQVLAGLLAGYAVVTEYPLAPVAAMLFVYGVATAKDRIPAALRILTGAAPCVALLGWYHADAFGSPFATGYKFVQNQTFASWHAQGFMGVTWPRPSSLAGNLFSAGRGLFAFSPAMLVALWGIRAQAREARAQTLLALTVAVFGYLLALGFVYAQWGRSLGPRRLALLAPLVVVPLASLVALFGRRAAREGGWNVAEGADAVLSLSVVLFYFFLAAAFLYEAWGWILGPRHLAPMIPFLVAPLACAIALLRRRAPRGPGWNLAGGAVAGLCAASVLVTAFCTVIFPHIPEEYTAALAHLVWPLAKAGYLPYNLGEVWLGRVAAWTWWPYFAALALVALATGARVLEKPRWLPSVAVAFLTCAAFIGLLFVAVPAESPKERETREWLEKQWEPTNANVRRGLF